MEREIDINVIAEILTIMQNYKKIDDALIVIVNKIKDLGDEREELLQQLLKNREREEVFYQDMAKKWDMNIPDVKKLIINNLKKLRTT
jgi:hypothetical protein